MSGAGRSRARQAPEAIAPEAIVDFDGEGLALAGAHAVLLAVAGKKSRQMLLQHHAT